MAHAIQINLSEFRKQPEHYVRRASAQRYVITDHGQPIAELHASTPPETGGASPWQTRKLRPEFKRLSESGAFLPKPGDRDITRLISDERDGD